MPNRVNMSPFGGSAFGGKKILLIIFATLLLAAGCDKVVLKKEVPTSPKESYEELPR